ncbi:hypothetical protein CDAR_286911 [Caerostris darwini]|uniref:Uncharacterized protein n=1 Tax=Caerostris darwini TaxID=1538125 RepID=A0AAV4RDF4_9ARAC|nr:hypothetical protein CDAR_286911 [Caerostris darwini]
MSAGWLVNEYCTNSIRDLMGHFAVAEGLHYISLTKDNLASSKRTAMPPRNNSNDCQNHIPNCFSVYRAPIKYAARQP